MKNAPMHRAWGRDMTGRRRSGVPRGSPTPVLAATLAGLSSVFGMGTGVNPAALAALMPTRGLEPRTTDNLSVGHDHLYVRAIQFTPGPVHTARMRSVRGPVQMNTHYE